MIQKGREVAVPCLAGGSPYRYRIEDDGRLYAITHGGRMLPEDNPFLRDAVNALAEMESRANEYHDTTDRQAKRIAELERACEGYQLRILEVERELTGEQRRRIECPCGGGPRHGEDWCPDYTEGSPS